MIGLHEIYAPNGGLHRGFDYAGFLWEMLAEREPHQNISHRSMPTMADHVDFVRHRPYKYWWLICEPSAEISPVGHCYLSKQNEIGIQVAKRHRGKRHASAALRELIERFGGDDLLANINPENSASAILFEKLGFRIIQHTYRREES